MPFTQRRVIAVQRMVCVLALLYNLPKSARTAAFRRVMLQIFAARTGVLGIGLQAGVRLLQLVLKRHIRLMFLRLLPACRRKIGKCLLPMRNR